MQLDLDDKRQGYIESSTTASKTSTTAQKRTTFLPQVAPADGLESVVWPEKWLELRARAKFPEPGSKKDDGELFPMMPAVDKSGQFGSIPLSSGDASIWLRELLGTSLDSEPGSTEGVSSRALKSTTLAWVSKHGGASPYERKVLGYHVDSTESTMHIYSRDVLAQPLRTYTKILSDAASGAFDPDATRSGMFKGSEEVGLLSSVASGNHKCLNTDGTLSDVEFDSASQLETVSSELVEVEVPAEVENPSSSCESESDPEASSGDDVALRSLQTVRLTGAAGSRAPANSICSAKLFHARLKTLHLVHRSNASKLACGRYIHAGFSLWEADFGSPSEDYPKFSVCFGKP